MARRRWYRRSTRVVAAKKKWASNLKVAELTSASPYTTLVANAPAESYPTPVILKTGNFKIQGDVSISTATGPAHICAQLFLVYVPENTLDSSSVTMAKNLQFVYRHPEYIMGWTALDLPIASTTTTVGGNKFSITSRLKRNLNSGDQIMLLLYNTTEEVLNVTYTAQYFTCSN